MRRTWPLLFLCSVWLACQPVDQTPDASVLVDAGSGQLVLIFDGDFGDVERFSTATHLARFLNVGQVPAAISRLAVEGEGFAVGEVGDVPVPVGGFRDVPIFFKPTRNGPHRARVSFQATTLPVLAHFTMDGFGVGPLQEATPTMVDFGRLPLFEGQVTRASVKLRLENVGDRWLQFAPEEPRWFATPVEELCVGEVDGVGRCLGRVTGFDPSAGIAPGRVLELPIHFATTTPGRRNWTITVRTASPGQPEITVHAQVDVVPQPLCRFSTSGALDFGTIEPLRSRELTMRFTNIGDAPCVIEGVSREEMGVTAFSVVDAPSWPQTVLPGGNLFLTVRARPDVAGPDFLSDSLRLTVNSPQLPSVSLWVDVATSCLVPLVRGVDFGVTRPMCRANSERVEVVNACAQPVTLSSVSLSSAAFTVSRDVTLPRVVAPGERLEVRVTRVADVQERRSIATLRFTYDDDVLVLPVNAVTSLGTSSEAFAAVSEKADVLLVVDRGPSMAPFLSKARAQLSTLYSQLAASGVDFRLGVINGNEDGGQLLASGGARWLTQSNGSDSRLLEYLLRPGTTAGASCLGAVRAALSAPWGTDVGINGGFLRDDATLTVLCVSGFSEAARPGEVEALRMLRPRVHFIGPVAGTPDCGTVAGNGPAELATTTTTPVCEADWSAALQQVVFDARGLRSRFELQSSAQSLAVRVGARTLSSDEWTYDGVTVGLAALTRERVEASFSPVCAP